MMTTTMTSKKHRSRHTNGLAKKPSYEECIANGCTHLMAEMLSAGKPPFAVTDNLTFSEGWKDQFDVGVPTVKAMGEMYRKKAAAAGVSTVGKKYLGSLANEPGDVRAWVSTRGEIQALCEERGWACHGSVNVTGRDMEAAEETPDFIAPDIVDDEVESFLDNNPEAVPHTPRESADLREKIEKSLLPDRSYVEP